MPPKTGMSAKRIAKELKDLDVELPDGIRAGLKNTDNLFEWYAQIQGPEDSVYEGGIFDLDISIPNDYPFRPPRAAFKTRIYHMNINSQGGICLDILKNQWSPALSVCKVILSVLSLLTDPNPSDPLVGEIASMYNRNRPLHDRTAREWTKTYAKASLASPPVPASGLFKEKAAAPDAAKASGSTNTKAGMVIDLEGDDKPAANQKGKAKENGARTIVIDDDDDNVPTGAKRSRPSSAVPPNPQAATKPRTAGTVIELD